MRQEERSAIAGAVSDSGVTWSIGADGLAEIVLDTPGEKVNLINPQTLAALDEAFAFFGRHVGVRGLVILSGKPGVFIAGADVKQIASVATPREAREKSLGGQIVFNQLAAFPFPTVAAISGACLGGGTELALACSSRVAADAEEVQIALPEVRLGLIPGWGGTQRLPRLVGAPAALDLILTGRSVTAREALRIGLVDAIAPPERLADLARRRAGGRDDSRMRASIGGGKAGARGGGSTSGLSPRASFLTRALSAAPLRTFVLARARSAARRASGGHYPAPEAALDAIATGLSRGLPEGLRREADLIGDLVCGEVSRNLVRIFLATRGGAAPAEERARGFEVKRIGILGAGVMGAGVAAVAASKGVSVRLKDVGLEPLERGLAHAHTILSGRGRRRRPEAAVLSRFMRISPTTDLSGFGSLDLVLEAVVEHLDVKRKVFAEIEPVVPERCILATNTSSLSVDAIAAGLSRPGRLIGLHFFNPADRMPLVEVIRGRASDPDAVASAFAFARKIGKTPVIAGDAPGFIVNRLLMPYLAEALRALQQGVAPETIDGDLVRFGMPMGPLALLDQIGLDVAAKVARVLADAFGGRVPPPTPLEALAKKGWLGSKSGAGFYLHRGGTGRAGQARQVNAEAVSIVRAGADGGSKDVAPNAGPGQGDLAARLTYPIINEAALVLDEGVAQDPSTIDVAMVLGTGFPPFLGGPLRWADRIGVASVVRRLEEMARVSGPHLAPTEPLRRIASGTGRFHGG